MNTGARICPRCATRVDERQARGSLTCLRCGAPLGSGTVSPVGLAGKPAKSGSALPWILGGVAVVLVLGTCGIGAVVVAASGGEEDPKPAPTATSTGTGQPNFESTASATASAGAKPPPTVVATAPKPTVTPTIVVTTPRPTATPTATPSPTPSPTPPPTNTNLPLGAFPRTKAQLEVDRVTAGLQSCHKAGDPSGRGSIRIDFEPDGRTGTVHRPPFAQTPMGSCISARFLAIKMGKFEGTTQSIEKTYTINATP